ncbi:MAG: hypothetical protein MSL49_01170 [Lactobacillus johnsonii]|nr:hypothetical protein [Lactobacillus johnsonii]
MKNIGIGAFVPFLIALFPWCVTFMRSHYLYSELKDTERFFLSLERRFEIKFTITSTFIISNLTAFFILLIILKIRGVYALMAMLINFVLFGIYEFIIIKYGNEHPRNLHVIINNIDYILLHRIDDKHISARPSQNKDDGSIILLSINEIINHRISIQ